MWQVRGSSAKEKLGRMLKSTSELHVFRGHQPSGTGFIMGHEFTGTVAEIGPDVKTIQKGDKVVCPFTISWLVFCSQKR